MDTNQIQAQLRLFKSYLKTESDNNIPVEKGIEKGILFGSQNIPTEVYNEAIEMYGLKPENFNEGFHKSFKVVKDSDLLTLYTQQVLHYITVYGFEALGIYNENTVYIPNEKLEIPELKEDVYLTLIKEITQEELTKQLTTLITSGIALSEETIKDIMTLSDYISTKDTYDYRLVSNREVRTALYNKYDIMPTNNVDYLRWLIKKVTGQTLFINNKELRSAIQLANEEEILKYLKQYVKLNGAVKLSEIFERYEDIFLSLKRKDNKELNKIINKISKLSKKHYKRKEEDILDNITKITTPDLFKKYKDEVEKALNRCTTFREVRILNTMKHRQTKTSDSCVYKVRNGKAFVRQRYNTKINYYVFRSLYNLIANDLADKVKKNIKGKTFYIPDNINYALPQSEKQFCQNIPCGTSIKAPKDKNIVIGIHWYNVNENRVDLDLHIRNRTSAYGWNSNYKDEENQILFSGDVTSPDPEKGATEVFYIGSKYKQEDSFTVSINKFTANRAEVPFELFIAYTDEKYVDKTFLVDPNQVIFKYDGKFEYDKATDKAVNEITLGIIKIEKDEIKFIFDNFTTGESIVTFTNELTNSIFDYLLEYTNTQIKLKDFISYCGGEFMPLPSYTESKYFERTEYDEFGKCEWYEITSERAKDLIDHGNGHILKEEKITYKADYNLSPEVLTKETLIKLLTI